MTKLVIPTPDISHQIWNEKQRFKDEPNWEASARRVVDAVYVNDRGIQAHEAFTYVRDKLWMPAGRIMAGAGTDRRVTLYNCFVAPLLQDSFAQLEGQPGEAIWRNLEVAAKTMQAGGGIGIDFSTLRPKRGAVRLGAAEGSTWSSGVVSFMRVWNEMSKTVTSAGNRRGAMMATLRIDHPDIEEFVTAKAVPGQLTEFNVSVLVTDAFMRAMDEDGAWRLWHPVAPYGGVNSGLIVEGQGKGNYIYKTMRARALWELITKQTYEYSEPGVIFIDRVNQLNPLYYCETISCTNPCGEQPLPPNNVCNLGHVNLAKMVDDPFTGQARVDWNLLGNVVSAGVRFLDNVVDITHHPTKEQEEEAKSKRRIGLGVTGLNNLFQQFRVRYGSEQSAELTEEVMGFIANAAYKASAALAAERGPFPAYIKKKHMDGAFMQRLGLGVHELVKEHGLRNGVILTVAPTGTTSLVYDNVDGGIEPCFSHKTVRRVRIEGDVYEERPYESWGLRAYREWCKGIGPWTLAAEKDLLAQTWMCTAKDLAVEDHLVIQAVAQRYVDASISKTNNVPADIPYEEFRQVYSKAYAMGLKGLTTYRPSATRGAVLTEQENSDGGVGDTGTGPIDVDLARKHLGLGLPGGAGDGHVGQPPVATNGKRPRWLPGRTYKVKLGDAPSMYVTVNDVTFQDGRVGHWEIFLNASEQENHGWATGVARFGSRLLRKGDSLWAMAAELTHAWGGVGGFSEGRYVPGYVAAVADALREHCAATAPSVSGSGGPVAKATGTPLTPIPVVSMASVSAAVMSTPIPVTTVEPSLPVSKPCPTCHQYTLQSKEGCLSCDCGWSNCR